LFQLRARVLIEVAKPLENGSALRRLVLR